MMESIVNFLKLILAILLAPAVWTSTQTFLRHLKVVPHESLHSFYLGVEIYIICFCFFFPLQAVYQEIGRAHV